MLGICHIGDQGADTRYFVVLGHHDPDDETKNYTYGAVMYDSVEDILQHVPSGKVHIQKHHPIGSASCKLCE